MSTAGPGTVVGVFADRAQAQAAVRELKAAGFRDDQVGMVGRGHQDDPALDEATGSRLAEGAGIGAATGAGVGALWALGIAAGVLPAIGPVIAGGLLMSLVASAGGAATVGTVVGALIGLGVPEDEAQYYEGEFTSGRTLVTVKAEARAVEAWTLLHRHGAYNRDVATHAGTSGSHASTTTGQTLQVHDEKGDVNVHGSNDPRK